MKRLLKSSAVISAMTMISRVLGLVRDAIFARYFPVDGAYDAFLTAFRIPNLLRRLVAEGAFSLAFVPVLSEYKEKRSRESLQDLLDHVSGTLGTILLTLSIVGVLASPLLIYLFAPGFSTTEGARPVLASDLLKITFPYILFISLSAFLSSILNTFQRFAIPAFTPVLLNVVLIVFAIWVSPYFEEPVTALAWGVFVGGIAQLAFQIPAVLRLGLLPRFRLKRGHEGVKKILKLMLPALIGSSAAQINLLINTAIASMVAVGAMGWLYYSDRFVELPLALFGVAIGTVILPKLSQNHAQDDNQEFSATMDWALRLALLISIPAMIGLVLLAKPILATVINYGAFGWNDVEMSGLSLMTYALGLPAFILVKVLAPGFYSRQDTKTPVKIGLIAIGSNIALNILIVAPWYFSGLPGPHAGLALATALSGYLNAGLLYFTLHRREIFTPQVGWLKDLSKMLLATCVMGALVWFVSPDSDWWKDATALPKVGTLAGLIALALFSYFVALFSMGLNVRKIMAR